MCQLLSQILPQVQNLLPGLNRRFRTGAFPAVFLGTFFPTTLRRALFPPVLRGTDFPPVERGTVFPPVVRGTDLPPVLRGLFAEIAGRVRVLAMF